MKDVHIGLRLQRIYARTKPKHRWNAEPDLIHVSRVSLTGLIIIRCHWETPYTSERDGVRVQLFDITPPSPSLSP